MLSLCDTYVDKHVTIACAQVEQHRRVVEMREIAHVLGLKELGRVHLLQLVALECALQFRVIMLMYSLSL